MSDRPKKVPITVPMPGDQEKSLTYFVIRCDREQDWSDDDIYDDGLHEMTEEEWRIYSKQVRESDGFDVDLFPNVIGGIIYPLDIDEGPETLHLCINLAMEEYCKKNDGKKLKFREPVKWNGKVMCPMDYYITFTAEDEETREVETYQALVVGMIPKEDSYVEMVRVKPKKRLPDASPPEESSSKKLCH